MIDGSSEEHITKILLFAIDDPETTEDILKIEKKVLQENSKDLNNFKDKKGIPVQNQEDIKIFNRELKKYSNNLEGFNIKKKSKKELRDTKIECKLLKKLKEVDMIDESKTSANKLVSFAYKNINKSSKYDQIMVMRIYEHIISIKKKIKELQVLNLEDKNIIKLFY